MRIYCTLPYINLFMPGVTRCLKYLENDGNILYESFVFVKVKYRLAFIKHCF